MEFCQDLPKEAEFHFASIPILLAPSAAADFSVNLCIDHKDDSVFLTTKMSYFDMFDIQTGKTLYRAKITAYTVFVTCVQESTRDEWTSLAS